MAAADVVPARHDSFTTIQAGRGFAAPPVVLYHAGKTAPSPGYSGARIAGPASGGRRPLRCRSTRCSTPAHWRRAPSPAGRLPLAWVARGVTGFAPLGVEEVTAPLLCEMPRNLLYGLASAVGLAGAVARAGRTGSLCRACC